jgi:hypothetical protein
VADICDEDSLARVRAYKQQLKAAAKTAAGTGAAAGRDAAGGTGTATDKGAAGKAGAKPAKANAKAR